MTASARRKSRCSTSVGENWTQTFIPRVGADDRKKKRVSPVVSLQCQTLFVFVRSKDKNSLSGSRHECRSEFAFPQRELTSSLISLNAMLLNECFKAHRKSVSEAV